MGNEVSGESQPPSTPVQEGQQSRNDTDESLHSHERLKRSHSDDGSTRGPVTPSSDFRRSRPLSPVRAEVPHSSSAMTASPSPSSRSDTARGRRAPPGSTTPQRITSFEHNDSHAEGTPSPTSMHDDLLANTYPGESEHQEWMDPVLVAASAGAAARQSKTDSRRFREQGSLSNALLPFRVTVDDDWRASLHRFRKVAATTAGSVAQTATPIVREAVAVLNDATRGARISAKDIVGSYQTTTQEGSEFDAERVKGEMDSTGGNPAEADGIHVVRDPKGLEKYGGIGFRHMILEEDVQADQPLATPRKASANFNEVETPLRKHAAPKLLVSPSAFSGSFASEHAVAVPSTSFMSPGTTDSTKPFAESTSSVGSFMPCGQVQRGSLASPQSTISSQGTFDHEKHRSLLGKSQHPVDSVSNELSLDASHRGDCDLPEMSSLSRAGAITPKYDRDERQHRYDSFDHLEHNSFARARRWLLVSGAGSWANQSKPRNGLPIEPSPQFVSLWDMVPRQDVDVPQIGGCLGIRQPRMVESPRTAFKTSRESKSDSDSSGGGLSCPSVDKSGPRSRQPIGEVVSVASEPEKVQTKIFQRRRKVSRRSRWSSAVDRSVAGSEHSSILLRESASMDHHANDERSVISVARFRAGRTVQSAEGVIHSADDISLKVLEVQDPDILQEEELMTFSSLKEINFLEGVTLEPLPEALECLALLLWRQLSANWRHDEMYKAMMTRPSSEHFRKREDVLDDVEWDNTLSATTVGAGDSRAAQNQVARSPHVSILSSNRSGFTPLLTTSDHPSLSMFLSRLACSDETQLRPAGEALLQHKLGSTSKVDACMLVRCANEYRMLFSDLLDELSFHAGYDSRMDREVAVVKFSVDIKTELSIVNKANRKYRGDLRQVKDVLRAQAVFPNESSLVCAISGLVMMCSSDESKIISKEKRKRLGRISIRRIKNLFGRESEWERLPTGYRHLLITIEIDDNFLAEIQCQLVHMYGLLQHEGYELHRELVELDGCDRHDMKVGPSPSSHSVLLRRIMSPRKKKGSEHPSTDALLVGILVIAMKEASRGSRHISDVCNLQLLCGFAMAHIEQSPPFSKFERNGDEAETDGSVDGEECDASADRQRFPAWMTRQFLRSVQEKALRRSLSIASKAVSIGMTGWLEYGSSNYLDRTVGRPLDIIGRVACHYARSKEWPVACDVLRTLVLQCEQHLPLYHPMTLTALLDLAATMAILSDVDSAKSLVHRAMVRLAFYLSERENAFLSCRETTCGLPMDTKVILEDCTGSDHVVMLESFVTTLRQLKQREYISVLDSDHDIVLLNHCLLADSLSVLANCVSLSEHSDMQSSSATVSSHEFWSEACHEYRAALEGWTMNGLAMNHPNLATTSCAIARCLRELDDHDHAIKILSSVLRARGDDPPQLNRPGSECRRNLREGNRYWHDQYDSRCHPTIAFAPPGVSGKDAYDPLCARLNVGLEQATALSLWSLAAYTVEASPNERGRIRALSLLHASSESLRAALERRTDCGGCSDALHEVSREMLQVVEDEAKELFEPIRSIGPPPFFTKWTRPDNHWWLDRQQPENKSQTGKAIEFTVA